MTDTRSDEAASAYVLGHSQRELDRLQRQAALFADLTRDILLRAGLSYGMRVLDIGCGVGDVSIVAADLVGPEGSVLGTDPATEALSLARARLDALGKPWVRFAPGTIESVEDGADFDAVIGRFILIHLADPAGALRGLIAIPEARYDRCLRRTRSRDRRRSAAPALLQQCVGWIGEVYRHTGRQARHGRRPLWHLSFGRAQTPDDRPDAHHRWRG